MTKSWYVLKPWFGLKRKLLMIFFSKKIANEGVAKVSYYKTGRHALCLWSDKVKKRGHLMFKLMFNLIYFVFEATDSAKLQVAKNAFAQIAEFLSKKWSFKPRRWMKKSFRMYTMPLWNFVQKIHFLKADHQGK